MPQEYKKPAGGREIERTEGRALLLMALISSAFIISFVNAVSGDCGSCNPCCNSSARVQEEQRHWTYEAYRFLYCDQCYPPFTPAYYPGRMENQSPEEETAGYWQAKGDELYLAGNYGEAVAAYQEALKLDRQSDVGMNLGNSLYFLGRYGEALDSYNARLNTNPQDENAWLGKVQSLLALNRTSEANAAQKTLDTINGRNITRIGSARMPVAVGGR